MNCDSQILMPESQWFAVWTRARQEKVVATIFEAIGVPHFLPLKSELRQWSDRKHLITVPLFSGYIFVSLNLAKDSTLPVLKTPGVVAFVKSQTGPLAIPDRQIEDIRTVLAAGARYSVQPHLKEGDRVRVVKGALAGIEGILIRANSESRLLLSIDMIRQSIAVSVSPDEAELVDTGYVIPAQLPVRPSLSF
jgi:transcription antitermination factor NusG